MPMQIETQFATNVISIFGGNQVLLGMTLLAFFIGMVALLRIPVQIVAPLYALALILVAILLGPAYMVMIAIIFGIVFATFIYSLWEK